MISTRARGALLIRIVSPCTSADRATHPPAGCDGRRTGPLSQDCPSENLYCLFRTVFGVGLLASSDRAPLLAAFFDVGHSLNDQKSNRLRHLPATLHGRFIR
jgi:hypothetical protein